MRLVVTGERHAHHAGNERGVELHLQGIDSARGPHHVERHVLIERLAPGRHEPLVLQQGQLLCEGIPGIDGPPVHAHDAVAGQHSGTCGSCSRQHGIHLGRDEDVDEDGLFLTHSEQAEVFGDINFLLTPVTLDSDHLGVNDVTQHVHPVAFERLVVCAEQDIAVAEAYVLCSLVELHAVTHLRQGVIAVAPCEEYHGVDEECQKEIEQHTAYHHQQALPRGLGAELPGLWRLGHLFLVHRLVNHAGYLHIASERKPSDAVLGVTVFGFIPEQGKPRVEEEIELLHPYFEQAGKEIMPSFVDDDEQGKRHHQLQGTNQECFHCVSL